jgi:hypothetical protein
MAYMTRERYEPVAIRYQVEFLLVKMSVVKMSVFPSAIDETFYSCFIAFHLMRE